MGKTRRPSPRLLSLSTGGECDRVDFAASSVSRASLRENVDHVVPKSFPKGFKVRNTPCTVQYKRYTYIDERSGFPSTHVQCMYYPWVKGILRTRAILLLTVQYHGPTLK